MPTWCRERKLYLLSVPQEGEWKILPNEELNLYSAKYCQSSQIKSDEWREVGSTHGDRNVIQVINLFKNLKRRDHLETLT
jgi:hypothetical protein